MRKDVRFAVVGLGMGMHHCKAIADAKGAVLAAVCDTDDARLHEAVAQYGCIGYSRWADLLKEPDIDCVSICVESGRHAAFGIEAAKAGKHIIMEKPVDITPAAIKRLRDAVNKAGVKAGCIFQSRLDPINIEIKRAIDRGRFGKLIGVHAMLPWWREQSYYEGPHGAWKGTWDIDGGGSLMNQGIHTVDLLQWLAGPVESVCGFHGVFSHQIEAEDQTVAVLRFENGALGTLSTTTCCDPGKDQRVFIFGTKGGVERNGNDYEFFKAGAQTERKRTRDGSVQQEPKESTSSNPMAVSADGHVLTVEDMVRAIRKDRAPLIPIEDATHAVEIATAIFKSGRTGRVVKVAEVRK